MEQAIAASLGCWREATRGAKTRISKSAVASFNKATEAGNSAKLIARTTALSAGEANMVANTDSVLIPDANRPRAIGATQLLQTASGIPAIAPSTALSQRELVRLRRNVARNERAAGPKRKEKVMPTRLASSQLIVVRQIRVVSG